MDTLQDRYEIQRQLGKKAGRQTLLALDLTTQEQVILKLLTFNSDFEWDDLKLFEREIETLKTLTHPAIPKYLDSFELNSPTQKGFVLVQSYLEAPSLEDHLKSGRQFSETEVKQIVRSLLEILQDLHDRHPPIIHRDIKPSNILLSDRSGNSPGKVYLIDFGSVQTLATQAGKTVTVVGTYGYMPPEQFGGISSPASDLYSVGMTAISLLTRTHPAELPQNNLYVQFESLTSISQSFETWLKQMTEPHPSQRFHSAQQALDVLKSPIDKSSQAISTPKSPNYLGEAILYSVVMSIKAGAITAAVLTVIALLAGGVGSFLIFGVFGTVTGLTWGSAVGLLNGLIVGIISHLKFSSLRDPNRHYVTVSAASLVSVITISWFAFTVTPQSSGVIGAMSGDFRWATIPFIVITTGVMMFANEKLIKKWYRRKDTWF